MSYLVHQPYCQVLNNYEKECKNDEVECNYCDDIICKHCNPKSFNGSFKCSSKNCGVIFCSKCQVKKYCQRCGGSVKMRSL